MATKPDPLSKKKKPASALDTAVNKLVRAAVGGDTSAVPDKDLDKYVAEMIIQEAAAKNKHYNKVGVRAYLPDTGVPPNTLPKTNKRFLLNIVKATDDHNQALIRQAQEQAAEKLREARREDERRKHRRGNGQDSYRGQDNARRRRGSRSRSWSRSPHSRSPNVTLGRDRTPDDREGDSNSYSDNDDNQPSSAQHILSPPSCDPSPRSRSESATPRPNTSPSRTPPSTSPPVTFKGRGAPTVGKSRMDRYFTATYDPSKDVDYALDDNGWMLDFSDLERATVNSGLKKDEKKEKKKKKKEEKKKKSGKSRKKHRRHDGKDEDEKQRRKGKKRSRRTGTDSEESGDESNDRSERENGNDDKVRRRRQKRQREYQSDSRSGSESEDDDHRRRKHRKDNKEKEVDGYDNKDKKKAADNNSGAMMNLQYGKGVREWDIAKLASGSWKK